MDEALKKELNWQMMVPLQSAILPSAVHCSNLQLQSTKFNMELLLPHMKKSPSSPSHSFPVALDKQHIYLQEVLLLCIQKCH